MAKSKKRNRRLRRSVRRTLGALCMITSIIVAAIPFPDAHAEQTASTNTEGLEYSYTHDVSGKPVTTGGFVIKDIDYNHKIATREKGTAYTISNVSGDWQMDWQFQYTYDGKGTDGYISLYNNQYQVDEIDLKYRVFSDYLQIDADSYANYNDSTDKEYNISLITGMNQKVDVPIKTLSYKYEMNGDGLVSQTGDGTVEWSKAAEYDFFNDNFFEEFEKYKKEYEDYILDPVANKKPQPLIRTYGDRYSSDVEQTQFLCDQVFGNGTPMSLVFVDKRIYDAQGEATGWEKVYVPRLKEKPEEGSTITIDNVTYYFDENGFLANQFHTIRGISDGAFKDVGNVKTLRMDREISYIGDSAFENSFVQSVELPMGCIIGNRSFKNCSRLSDVTIPEGVKKIGTEAFYGTLIKEVILPDSINEVGPGAFANCVQLTDVSFLGSVTEKTIGDCAFYDCTKLNKCNFGEANIVSIGKGAFAISKVVNGNLNDFQFPHNISDASCIGEYLLGNRTNIETVTMPRNLGNSNKTELNNKVFYHCNNLVNVTFPETCTYISYPSNLFSDVVRPEFYVRGPKCVAGSGTATEPRKSTWNAVYNQQEHVPYVYSENGQDYYEVSDGTYLQVIDGSGILVSCEFVGPAEKIGELNPDGTIQSSFKIPSQVGITKVTGIKEGCFGDPSVPNDIINWIQVLEVEDGSDIKKIDDYVFRNASILKYVYLGDSLNSIGTGTFENCSVLEKVDIGPNITNIGPAAFKNNNSLKEISLASPSGGAESFPLANIGDKAFSTNGKELTIYGLIQGGYGPFDWAMQENNYMDPASGIRVCYKSPKDTVQGMTVVLDNSNNLPTLVDYPVWTDPEIEDIKNKIDAGTALTPTEEAALNAVINVVIPSGVKSIDVDGYLNSNSNLVGSKPSYTSNNATISTYFKDLKDDYQEGLHGLFNSNEKKGVGEYKTDEAENDLYEKVEDGNDRVETVSMPTVVYLPDNCFYSCERLSAIDLGAEMKDVGDLPFLGANNLASVGCTSGKYTYNNGILYEELEDGTKSLIECVAGRGNIVGTSALSVDNDPDLTNVSNIEPRAFQDCPYLTTADFTDASLINEIPEECFLGDEMLTEVDLPPNVKLIGDRCLAGTGDYTKVIVRGHEVGLGKNIFGDTQHDDKVKQPFLVSYEDSAVRVAASKQGINVDEVLDEMLTVKFYMPDAKTLVATEFVQSGSNAKKIAPDQDEMFEKGFLKEGEILVGWNGAEDLTNITKECIFIANISTEQEEDSTEDGDDSSDKGEDSTGNGDNSSGNNGDSSGNSDSNSGNGDNNSGNGGNNSGNGDSSSGSNGDSSGSDGSKPADKKTLTVVYGNGSGTYQAGTTVIISAIEAPAGKEFYKWTTDQTGLTITSATSAATTVKMPNTDATVTATYRDKSSVSGNNSKPVNKKPNSSTEVTITKPGISNTDKAYASVNGSTDNFVVKITETSEAANAVATALSNEYANMEPIKYFAMDISLYDKKGNKITNTNGLSVNVTMPIPDALVQYGGNNKVGAVVNGNVLEKLNCKFTTVSGIPCVTFTATHFSPYTVYVDTSNLSTNVLDTTPKTGDGIHPKWLLSIGLACLSLVLFMKKDKSVIAVQ